MADVSDLEQAKKEIRAILTSRSGNCMTMRELSIDYKSIIGNDIPFASLGFSSLTSFLRTLTDTVGYYFTLFIFIESIKYRASPNYILHLSAYYLVSFTISLNLIIYYTYSIIRIFSRFTWKQPVFLVDRLCIWFVPITVRTFKNW